MGNGKKGVGNREWAMEKKGVGNREWAMGNGKKGVGNRDLFFKCSNKRNNHSSFRL